MYSPYSQDSNLVLASINEHLKKHIDNHFPFTKNNIIEDLDNQFKADTYYPLIDILKAIYQSESPRRDLSTQQRLERLEKALSAQKKYIFIKDLIGEKRWERLEKGFLQSQTEDGKLLSTEQRLARLEKALSTAQNIALNTLSTQQCLTSLERDFLESRPKGYLVLIDEVITHIPNYFDSTATTIIKALNEAFPNESKRYPLLDILKSIRELELQGEDLRPEFRFNLTEQRLTSLQTKILKNHPQGAVFLIGEFIKLIPTYFDSTASATIKALRQKFPEESIPYSLYAITNEIFRFNIETVETHSYSLIYINLIHENLAKLEAKVCQRLIESRAKSAEDHMSKSAYVKSILNSKKKPSAIVSAIKNLIAQKPPRALFQSEDFKTLFPENPAYENHAVIQSGLIEFCSKIISNNRLHLLDLFNTGFANYLIPEAKKFSLEEFQTLLSNFLSLNDQQVQQLNWILTSAKIFDCSIFNWLLNSFSSMKLTLDESLLEALYVVLQDVNTQKKLKTPILENFVQPILSSENLLRLNLESRLKFTQTALKESIAGIKKSKSSSKTDDWKKQVDACLDNLDRQVSLGTLVLHNHCRQQNSHEKALLASTPFKEEAQRNGQADHREYQQP